MKVKKGKAITIICSGGRDTHTGEILTTTFTGEVSSTKSGTIHMNLIGAFQITRTQTTQKT